MSSIAWKYTIVTQPESAPQQGYFLNLKQQQNSLQSNVSTVQYSAQSWLNRRKEAHPARAWQGPLLCKQQQHILGQVSSHAAVRQHKELQGQNLLSETTPGPDPNPLLYWLPAPSRKCKLHCMQKKQGKKPDLIAKLNKPISWELNMIQPNTTLSKSEPLSCWMSRLPTFVSSAVESTTMSPVHFVFPGLRLFPAEALVPWLPQSGERYATATWNACSIGKPQNDSQLKKAQSSWKHLTWLSATCILISAAIHERQLGGFKYQEK